MRGVSGLGERGRGEVYGEGEGMGDGGGWRGRVRCREAWWVEVGWGGWLGGLRVEMK